MMIPHLLLFMAMTAQTRAGSAEAVQHVQTGIAAEQQGRHDDAIQQFQTATRLDPQFAAAYVNLGTVYMEQGSYAKAIPPLRRAIQLNENIEGARGMLGVALLTQGYSAEAIPYLKAAGLQGPLGIAQLETGDLENSIISLGAALKEHPNDPQLLFSLSRAAGLLSKQAGDALLATHPNSAPAHEALAENYWGLQRAANAEKEYQTALQLQPQLPGAHLALGKIYASTQQWTQAEQQFQAEATLRPGDAESAYRLGDALLTNGKIRQAQAELTRADKLQPDMPEILYDLGKAESLNGDVGGAEASWKHLLRIEPNSDLSAKAHFGLAGIYRKQGKPAQAAREMKAFESMKGNKNP
ncbi:MAG TPA: tetratricopeptide repeat protein [Acidobacteriaceae bacterium]|nr:tetratricopeptide repeat protein [Acidobacteriaceae bacterium]